MLFSVVVPVYNTQDYLGKCIDSILYEGQSCKNEIEILLVDDGSTDNSPEICDAYQKKYPEIIRVFHKQNEGLLATRRYGYCRAQGKYIVNCDSDDYVGNDIFHELIRVIQVKEYDVILFNAIKVIGNESNEPFCVDVFTHDNYTEVSKEDILEDYLCSYHVVSMWSKVFKKECLSLTLDYTSFGKLNFGEDTLQSAEIYTNADKYVYINKAFYFYRMGSGMTGMYRENYYAEFELVCKGVESFAKNWEKNNIECKLSFRYFEIVSRTISQTRYKIEITYSERKKIMQAIAESEEYKKYRKYYCKARKNLSSKHKLLCDLFRVRAYRMIDLILRIKDVISIN